MLHARDNSREISVTCEDDKGRVGFSCLDGGLLLHIAVLGDAFLVGGMRFRAELLGYVGEGCCTAILLMGDTEDEV